ncbi:amidohydrolase family protein [Oscillibacter valericigenes]|uniref:amidohydrolase family protein n=1 Tax=Oscillibacter valericigenes TaxID=351091 RepID=UPI001F45D93C|nr:amidohydrolase [Oscillibacter valericigenes]
MKNRIVLIPCGCILTMNDKGDVLRNTTIVSEEGKIKALLPNSEARTAYPDAEIVDASNKVVIPGLVNVHMHSNLTRGFGDNMALYAWHEAIAETVGMETSPEEMQMGALISYLEAVKSGTTTMLSMEKYSAYCYEAAKASGARVRIVPYVLDFDDCVDKVELNLEYVEKTLDPSLRTRFIFGFDSFREAGPDLIRQVVELSNKYDIMMQTHSCESVDDVTLCLELHGCEPTKYLHKLGALNKNMILAHGVHLTEEEKQLVTQTGARIAHCPTSNMKLSDGAAPVKEYMDRGILVGIGTDGANSNNNYDMLEEIKFAALLPRISTKKADDLTAETVLRMATIEGAKVLGMDDIIGSVEVGKCTDLCILDMRNLHCLPYDLDEPGILMSHIVYSCNGSDVDSVIVDGEVLVKNHTLTRFDEESVFAAANILSKNLTQRLKKRGVNM